MDNIKIACLDVYYYKEYAKACAIVFEIESFESIISKYCEIIGPVHSYVPGQFYKRELPCLLKVYGRIKENIDIIIVDGFAFWDEGKKGLGAYLFQALDEKVAIIGVAKTFFMGCTNYIKIYRGQSNRPLYISCLGIDLSYSIGLIKNLKGENRIPDILKRVDHLTRI